METFISHKYRGTEGVFVSHKVKEIDMTHGFIVICLFSDISESLVPERKDRKVSIIYYDTHF